MMQTNGTMRIVETFVRDNPNHMWLCIGLGFNWLKILFLPDMVVSGIPVATPFHAREIANMAIDLVEACTVFTIPHMPCEPLKIRVGLHSGKHKIHVTTMI